MAIIAVSRPTSDNVAGDGAEVPEGLFVTPKPTALRPYPDAIPAELRQRRQWIVWRYEWVVEKGEGKWDKPPSQARNPRRYAATSRPREWATFDEAWAAYLDPQNELDGVGFVLTADDD